MKFIKKLFFLFIFGSVLISCNESDPWEFVPPDFSSVPGRYDITGMEPVEIDKGVTAYIVDENEDEPYFITRRDIAYVYITLRTDEGDIIFSSFANDMSSLIGLRVTDLGTVMPFQGRQMYHQDMLNSPGLQTGILGMRENERRTLIVEPEQGFKNAPMTLPNEEYRNSTLIYDIHVSRIEPS